MGKKRVPLESDADSREPFTADPDHLKERMDKSHMPEEAEPRRRSRKRKRRPQREQTVGGRQYIEQQAVQMLVDTLREKGVSEQFITDNMETIRNKALDHLYGRDRPGKRAGQS